MNMLLVGCFHTVHVAIAYSRQGGSSVNGECHIVISSHDLATFLVDQGDADVLKVLAVSFPCGVVVFQLQGCWLACGLYLVTCHDFAVLIGDGLETA